jgi:hypothetical protein
VMIDYIENRTLSWLNLTLNSRSCRAYWHDLDTALFILKHLYRDIPEEPPAPPPSPGSLDAIEEGAEVTEASTLIESVQLDDPDDIPLTFTSKDKIAAVFAAAKEVDPNWTEKKVQLDTAD